MPSFFRSLLGRHEAKLLILAGDGGHRRQAVRGRSDSSREVSPPVTRRTTASRVATDTPHCVDTKALRARTPSHTVSRKGASVQQGLQLNPTAFSSLF